MRHSTTASTDAASTRVVLTLIHTSSTEESVSKTKDELLWPEKLTLEKTSAQLGVRGKHDVRGGELKRIRIVDGVARQRHMCGGEATRRIVQVGVHLENARRVEREKKKKKKSQFCSDRNAPVCA